MIKKYTPSKLKVFELRQKESNPQQQRPRENRDSLKPTKTYKPTKGSRFETALEGRGPDKVLSTAIEALNQEVEDYEVEILRSAQNLAAEDKLDAVSAVHVHKAATIISQKRKEEGEWRLTQPKLVEPLGALLISTGLALVTGNSFWLDSRIQDFLPLVLFFLGFWMLPSISFKLAAGTVLFGGAVLSISDPSFWTAILAKQVTFIGAILFGLWLLIGAAREASRTSPRSQELFSHRHDPHWRYDPPWPAPPQDPDSGPEPQEKDN